MIACNANTTRHYIPRIPSELNKKEEERTNTFKKSIQKRVPLWETAFRRGSDSNTIPTSFEYYPYFLFYNISVNLSIPRSPFYSLYLHFHSPSLTAYFSAMLTASSPSSSVMNCREQASSSRAFAALHA